MVIALSAVRKDWDIELMPLESVELESANFCSHKKVRYKSYDASDRKRELLNLELADS